MLPNYPTGGTGALPGPGAPCCSIVAGTSSRAISSWYFGDGALLFNQVASGFSSVPAIVPLDLALNHSVAQRQPGGSFGGRISYDITPRFAAELSLDYGLGKMEIRSRGRTEIAATSASFANSFNALFGLIGSPSAATSTPVIHSDGRQVFLTGALNANLLTSGKVIPYVTVGAGLIRDVGGLPSATLVGNYTFSLTPGSDPINETDTLRLHYRASDTRLFGVLGNGIKIYVTPHWGFRLDARAHFSANSVDNLLDATPSRTTASPGSAVIAVNPANKTALVFSNRASTQNSLSGPALANFRTFTSSGTQIQVGLTAGLFWRF